MVLPLVLVVALLAATGAVVAAGTSLFASRSAERATEQLTAAAIEVAVLLSSLSSDTAESSLDRLAELSTGTLQEEVAARRAEVLDVVDDDEIRVSTDVIASGVEHAVSPRGLFSGSSEPASAGLLIATRSEVGNSRAGTRPGGSTPVVSERIWRWRIEAVLIDGQAFVSSAEVAV